MRDIKYSFEQKVLNFLLPVTDRWLIHHQATSAGHFGTDPCHLRIMMKLELLLQIDRFRGDYCNLNGSIGYDEYRTSSQYQ